MALVEAPGQRRGDEHLAQIDASVALAAVGAERIAPVVGVHAAVAVHRQAEGETLVELAGVAELGDQEGVAVVAVVLAVGRAGGTEVVAVDLHAAVGLEVGHAEIQTVAHQRGAGRVGRCRQGILRQGVADSGHAERLDAVAVGEIAVGGEGQRTDGGASGEQDSE
ncbi:hypothetical protein D3C81_1762770 [compost metagenome]